MADFLLLHGASSTGWIWHRVVAELTARGHAAVAPDLPCADPSADLHSYLDVAVAAGSEFGAAPVIVVAQSMAGLYAAAVAERRPVSRLVLVAAMIPRPGESGNDWFASSGAGAAQAAYLTQFGLGDADPYDPELIFVHDFDDRLKQESAQHVVEQSARPMETPTPFDAWPSVPTHVVAAAEDRLFPLAFMQAQSRERLGLEPDVIPGGHLALLSHADALAALLVSYAEGSDTNAATHARTLDEVGATRASTT